MNKLLPFLFLVPFLSSCGSAYKIEGTSSIDEFDGKMVYLKAFMEDGVWDVDSAEVIHGTFKMKGNIDSTAMVTLFLGDESVMPLILEDGVIKINVAYSNLSAGGTPLNDALYGFIARKNDLDVKTEELSKREARMILDGFDADEAQSQVQREADELEKEMSVHIKKFISDNYETVLGPGVFIMLCSGLPYPILTPQIEDILKDAPYSFKSNRMVKEFVNKAKENMQLLEEYRRVRESGTEN